VEGKEKRQKEKVKRAKAKGKRAKFQVPDSKFQTTNNNGQITTDKEQKTTNKKQKTTNTEQQTKNTNQNLPMPQFPYTSLSRKQKIKAMLWDLPADKRDIVAREIIDNPYIIFNNNEQLFLKALNSLSWYDLKNMLGKQKLFDLLDDSTINKLFPPQRRKFYHNAKRLLSTYALSTPE